MSHRSLELIASPSMATAFVIPSSVPSPMSPATPNVTSSFAPPSPTNIYEQSASISASSSFIMGTTPTSPKNIHPHASPSCSSLSPTFQIPNSKFQIRPPSSSPTFQIQATTDSLS